MPRRRSVNTEAMIQAAAEGGRLAQRGQEAVLSERQAAAGAVQEGMQRAGSELVGVGERQKDRETQAEEARKERIHRGTEATKERAQRQKLQDQEIASREKMEEGRQAIEAADKGLVQTNGSGATAQAVDPRAQQVQDDMARGAAQMEKPLEHATDGRPRYVASEARQQAEQGKAETARMNAETAAANAQLARERLVSQHKDAQVRGDEKALEQSRAAFEAPLKADQKLLDDIGTGKLGPNDARWDAILRMVNDPVHGPPPSPALMDEVENHERGGPYTNLRNFISARQMSGVIRMALETGDLPDGRYIDTTSQTYQRFNAARLQAHDFMAKGALSNFVDVTSTLHKQRLVNQAAALIVTLQPMMGQMVQQGAAGAGQGDGGGAAQQQSGQPGAAGPTEQPFVPRQSLRRE